MGPNSAPARSEVHDHGRRDRTRQHRARPCGVGRPGAKEDRAQQREPHIRRCRAQAGEAQKHDAREHPAPQRQRQPGGRADCRAPLGAGMVERQGQGEREDAQRRVERGGQREGTGCMTGDTGRPRGQRDGCGPGHHGDGAQREHGRERRDPGGAERGNGARQQPGAGADGEESGDGLRAAEQPRRARDARDEPPFEARAERGTEPADRERGQRRERTEGGPVQHPDPRTQHESEEDERYRRRQNRVDAVRRRPPQPGQARGGESGDREQRQRGNGIHARTFASA